MTSGMIVCISIDTVKKQKEEKEEVGAWVFGIF